ncbi:hypothetical protein DFH09DRAFT_1096022 [Mycena vulgaris]|nr:hypothetical protein DFH09DRAFT_1096022 [Mycena vulgaris]
MLPRARIADRLYGICRLPAPRTPRSSNPREDGDATPPRALPAPPAPRSSAYLHPRASTRSRYCAVLLLPAPPNAAHARRTAGASYLHPDRRRIIHRASAGFVPDSPPAHWDDTRRMSARVGARAEASTEHATTHVLTLRTLRRRVNEACGARSVGRDHDSLARSFIKRKGGKRRRCHSRAAQPSTAGPRAGRHSAESKTRWLRVSMSASRAASVSAGDDDEWEKE